MKQPIRLIALGAIIVIMIVIAVFVTRWATNRGQGRHITIEFYNDWAGGHTGEGIGWFAQIVEERFNMTIDYLGAGNMEELFQSRRAAGDLGDLVIIGTHRLRETINDGLLLDITGLVETRMTSYTTYFPGAVERARQLTLTDSIYALPIQVSTQPASSPRISGLVPNNGAFLRQDAYMAIGAPTIYTIENLLAILVDMQRAVPYSESGQRTYGFSLYSGPEDDTILHTAAAFATLYGGMDWFSSTGFIDFQNQVFESFLDINGLYLRALKLYFDANQLGILDPTSQDQSWEDIWEKFEDGAVLFSWWSWLGMQSFNTPGRAAQGIGYNFIPIMNQRIHHDFSINPSGPNHPDLVIGVGANASNPERIVDFIDWLASPEGNQIVNAGPEGLTWEMENNIPVLTEFGLSAGVHTGSFRDVEVPSAWGGGTFSQGAWHGNITVPISLYGRELNPLTGLPFNPRLWPSAAYADVTRLQSEWTARFGSNTPLDFVLDNGMISAPPTVNFTRPMDSQNIREMRDAIRPVIETASWQMIFAGTEAEFYSIWLDMNAVVHALGWDYVLEHDQRVAEELFAAQQAALLSHNHLGSIQQ
ncbi:MAG: extracellular solute-binding protein [Defluviitaleaceae bacterium]|nr:extracellular solute-binding protein [Defluviitaleaceae bacterium]